MSYRDIRAVSGGSDLRLRLPWQFKGVAIDPPHAEADRNIEKVGDFLPHASHLGLL